MRHEPKTTIFFLTLNDSNKFRFNAHCCCYYLLDFDLIYFNEINTLSAILFSQLQSIHRRALDFTFSVYNMNFISIEFNDIWVSVWNYYYWLWLNSLSGSPRSLYFRQLKVSIFGTIFLSVLWTKYATEWIRWPKYQ